MRIVSGNIHFIRFDIETLKIFADALEPDFLCLQ